MYAKPDEAWEYTVYGLGVAYNGRFRTTAGFVKRPILYNGRIRATVEKTRDSVHKKQEIGRFRPTSEKKRDIGPDGQRP